MKIGFIGNANNYPLMLARELKNLGYEIEFILAQNYHLDRPENKYPEYEQGYPNWMHNLIHWDVWNYSKQESKKFFKAIEILSKCDLVVLNQYYICLAPYIQKPWIAMITGTDLLTLCVKEEVINWYANPKFFPSTKFLEYKQYLYFALNRMEEQRFAIRNAMFVTSFPRGIIKNYDSIFDDIGAEEVKKFPLIMIDTLNEKSNPYFPSNSKSLNITITARLTWDKSKKDSTEIDYKGNDIFLKGFAEFIKKNPNKKIQLNLFKKGVDIQETIDLIQNLGLSDYCSWQNELSQKEFSEFLKQSHIAVDQIGTSAIGMAGLETLSYGIPLIATDTLKMFGVNDSPVLNSRTPEDVAKNLEKLLDESFYREISKKSIECVKEHFTVQRKAKEFLELIERLYPDFQFKENFYLTAFKKQERRKTLLKSYERNFYLQKLYYSRLAPILPTLLSKYNLNPNTGEMIVPKDWIHPEQGFCFIFSIPEFKIISDEELNPFGENLSPILLYENETRLPIPHSPHEEIRKIGRGRYSHWSIDIYFSSSDNTDPRKNGRTYKIKIRGIKKFLKSNG